MKVSIRADASLRIGTGHLMRCRTLAEELKQRGAEVCFICRRHSGNMIELLRNTFPLHELPPPPIDTQNASDEDYAAWLGVTQEQDAVETIAALQGIRPDWLIVDHYALDKTWETALRSHVGRIMVIDDLANRAHDCDLLLDQNLYSDMDVRYKDLVPTHCELLLGPKYALLRPEFREARKNLRIRDGTVKRILVFFGGTDPTNETTKVIQALKELELDCTVDVVVGASNPNKKAIKQYCADIANFNYYEQTDRMAELMAQADLAIGAGGSSVWERCCLGLPTLSLALVANQTPLIAQLKNQFALVEMPNDANYTNFIKYFFNFIQYNQNLLSEIQKNSFSLCDGTGAQRVVDTLLPKKIDVRSPTLDDAYIIYKWRNDKRIRDISLNKEEIELDKHMQWFKDTLDRTDRILVLAEVASVPIGVVRFDLQDTWAEISIFMNPDYTGQRFGRSMYLQAEKFLKANLLKKNTQLAYLKAVVLTGNNRSESFFSHLGYRKVLTEYRKDFI